MLNQITIQGRMTREAEVKNTPSGKTVTVFCVAVQRNYKNAEGKYESDFIDCVAYDRTGEFIRQYFHKGEMILLNGELTTRTYEDKNGTKHKVASIIVSKTYFTGNNESKPTAVAQPTQSVAPVAQEEQFDSSGGGELPFSI